MNISNSTKKKILTVLFVAVLILASISTLELFVDQIYDLDYQEVVGKHTLPCSLQEPDGNVAHFYGTGDMRFRYAHDEYGYVLMQNSGGYMVYAQNQDGRPTPGNVRYGASKEQVAYTPKMSYADIDFSAHPDLISDWEGIDYTESSILQAQATTTLVNVIVFIEYKDTTFTVPSDNFASLLTAEDNSLRDYYYNITYGNLDFESAYPINGNSVFVYKAPQNRNYYDIGDGPTRYSRESKLLTAAVNAVNSKIDTAGLNLDTNNDNRIDAVTFIMQGSASSTWGGLLWPHAWDLYYANGAYNGGASAKIGGIEVGKYNMQFEDSINQGVLCHEMSHVLGAPDLYHYNDPEKYAPVGEWDLMQSNLSPPQYMLTHTRQKYIGYIAEEQIGEIEHSGIYALKPTVSATNSDVLAYRIDSPYSQNEYFMVEYRNNSLATYDSELPGSGLVVYRINITAQEGNKNAKYQNPAYPDEVYVFRPSVATIGTIEQRSRQNLGHAWLSPNNPNFSSVGKNIGYSGAPYSNQTLYFSDGSNSGITIEAIAMSEQGLAFSVRLSDEDAVDATYFQSKISLNNAELVNNSLLSGVQAIVHFGEIDTSYLKSLKIELLDEQMNLMATNTLNLFKFYAQYQQAVRSFSTYFVVNNKDNLISSAFSLGTLGNFNEPYYIRLVVEDADSDEIELGIYPISSSSCSWEQVLATKKEVIAGLSVSNAESVGLRFDGTVVSSGYYNYDDYFDIIAIASAFNHTLLLSKGLTVTAVGSGSHNKLLVDSWQDIVKIAASKDNSYGVDLQGKVYAVGSNMYGQLSIANLNNAKDIKSGANHVAVLGIDGRVYGAGDNSEGQLNFSAWSDIIAIDAHDTYTVGLREGGNVLVAGKINAESVVLGWGNVAKISAGSDYLLAINTDGKVLSYGAGQGGKASVQDLQDIIDISAGVTHSAFLRSDGLVLYRGDNSQATQAIANLLTDDYITLVSIGLNAHQKELELSQTFKLQVYAQPQDASYQAFDFISLDEQIATVDADGTIRTHKEGSTTIRVLHRDSDVYADCILTVVNPILIESVSFDLSERSIVIDDSSFLNVVTIPANATKSKQGVFSSSDPDIVQVNPHTGEVIGKALGSAVITVTIDDFGADKIAQCTVTVIDGIDSIEISTHITKKGYFYGDSLDLSGGIIKVITKTGSEYELSMTIDMITGYDCYDINPDGQELTVTIDKKSVTFTVLVSDYDIGIEIVQPIKTAYEYGEQLDTSGGKLVKNFASSNQSELIDITADMIAGYSPQQFGDQLLTLTYDGWTLQFYIVLTDPIYQIAPNFSKKKFAYGEQLSESETFKIKKLSGAEEYIDIVHAQVSGFNPYILGIQSITLTYQGYQTHETLEIDDILETLELIGVKRQGCFMFYDNAYPLIEVKAHFEQGGVFGVTCNSHDNLYVAFFMQGVQLQPTDFTQANLGFISNIDLQVYGKRRTSGGDINNVFLKAVSIDLINIIEVVDIEVVYQSEYNRSQISSIADLGIQVKVTDINGGITIEEPDSISIDLDIFTTQDVQVAYLDFYKTVQITLINNPIRIECEDNLTYGYGEEFSATVVLVKYNGGRQILSVGEYTIFGFDSYTLGNQTTTLGYQTLSLQINVEIIEDIDFFELVVDGIEEYNIGAAIVFADKIVVITYHSGATREATLDDAFTIKPYNNMIVGRTSIEIEHTASSKTYLYEVEFNNYAVAIRADVDKLIYEYGEELTLSAVYLVWANGDETAIIDKCDYRNYDKHNIARQKVTVSYQSFEDVFEYSFYVEVVDVLEVLELITAPNKVTYNYGQALNLTGIIVKATYRGKGQVNISDPTLLAFNYNPIRTGVQTVTVSLEGASCTFQVSVRFAPQALFEYSDQEVSMHTGKVLFYQSLFISEVLDKIELTDYYYYLFIILIDKEGNQVDVNAEQYAATLINGDYKILVKNTANQEIASLNVGIYGDINNDGEFTNDDLQLLAQKFLQGNYQEELDYNSDGEYNLVDFVNWVKAANKKIDPNGLLLFFKGLVAPPIKRYEL